MTNTADFLVVGAGMAGTSAAAALSDHGTVVLLERESQPAYHATGRSAAIFTETYGNRVIRVLSAASRSFFTTPPDGFAAQPLLTPRGVMVIATAAQTPALEAQIERTREFATDLQRLTGDAARRLVPMLRPGHVAAASLEPAACDIDVHALHRGYLRQLRAAGGVLVVAAEVTALSRRGDSWTLASRAGTWTAPVVVNAAGAWADEVARCAGVTPVGLVPNRRTAALIAVPPHLAAGLAHWPATVDVAESFYFKPDAGRLLVSPADETPSAPCDAQPDEIDVAVAIERLSAAADIAVHRIEHKWAGLRTFAADRTPVVGYDPACPGFFWLAGQGGYGIQTAPAMARLAAALAVGAAIPADIAARGVTGDDLTPARFPKGPPVA